MSQPHPLWELTKTRIREFTREKGALFWVFGFPLLMAIGLGMAFRNKPSELPRIAVVSSEAAPAQLEQAALTSNRLLATRYERTEAERALRTSKVDLVLEWQSGAPTIRFDPTQERAPYARLVTLDVLERAQGRKDVGHVSEQPVSEVGRRYIDFLLPGLIGLNLMGSSMWGVGFNLAVARKRRLLRRYAVTPMQRSHFLLSYFFSRSAFLILELGFLLAFGHFVFGTVLRGNFGTLLGVAVLGAASFAAISLIIGARMDNTEAATGWMNFVQLPMWVLSGSFFSYERFPEWLHAPIRLLPLTALNDGLRAVFNEAAGWSSVWPQAAVLLSWGVVGFFVALRYFRWQ